MVTLCSLITNVGFPFLTLLLRLHAAAPSIPIEDILKKLKVLVSSGSAVKLYNHRSRALRISEMKYSIGDSQATLLIQLCDKNGSDPVLVS